MTARDEIVYEAHHEEPPHQEAADAGKSTDPKTVEDWMREDAGYYLSCVSEPDLMDFIGRLFVALECDERLMNSGLVGTNLQKCVSAEIAGTARLRAERNRGR
jgi:hypothetical protein